MLHTDRIVRSTRVSPGGGWLDVHVQTPPWICGPRDGKGLYAKAQAGIISAFTGISDPYEVPETPEVRTGTREITWDLVAHRILVKLDGQGCTRPVVDYLR